MTSGGKILLGLLAIGGFSLAIFHSGQAHADSLPPRDPLNPDPNPLPLPGIPSLPGLPPQGQVIPPAGTPIPLPGGGVVTVPVIPGGNAPAQVPQPVIVPLPASTSPFPAVTLPPPGSTVNIPGVGPVTVPNTTIPSLPSLPAAVTPGPALPPSAPPASAAELPGQAPADTLALVTSMLRTEQQPHWRVSDPLLRAWQSARGHVADGQFGTGDALTLAQEIGTVPIIRGWPKGSNQSQAVPAYRAALLKIAATAPEPRASQLRLSAAREQGQGYGTPERPIAQLITIQS